MIEVELKFYVEDLAELRNRLISNGAVSKETVVQSDEYLNDTLRDFKKADKALRIRQYNDNYFMTYKGPNFDPVAKIRREIELPLVDEAAAVQLRDAFLEMDFYSVAKVVKRREKLSYLWQEQAVEICLDDVDEVGAFCELELVVESEAEMDAAKEALTKLADEFGLKNPTCVSYLALLLQNRGVE